MKGTKKSPKKQEQLAKSNKEIEKKKIPFSN
jgi:hypothetical protein